MKVVILCGGRGTRMGQTTEAIPKPLVKIGELPILVHVMKCYAQYGIKDFVLCLGYRGDAIKRYFLEQQWLHGDFDYNTKSQKITHANPIEDDWNITFAETGLEAHSGARVKKIRKYIGDEPFCMTYGDGVSDLDINELLKFHKTHGKMVTVTSVRPRSRFGSLEIEGDQVNSFVKKVLTNKGWIDGGFFVMNPEFFKHLSEDDLCEIEKGPLQEVAEKNEFMAFKHDGYWQCMDTLKDKEILTEAAGLTNIPWLKD